MTAEQKMTAEQETAARQKTDSGQGCCDSGSTGSPDRKMHFIVTGAGSFLGRNLVEYLRADGHEVTAFRHSFDGRFPGEELPKDADIWVHFAWGGRGSEGRSDPGIQHENVMMSLEALTAAMRTGCGKFVFAGSQAEYGGIHTAYPDGLQHESDRCFPVSAYGRAKLEFGDRAVMTLNRFNSEGMEFPMEYLHLRYFSVFGPGDHEGALISTALRAFAGNAPLELGSCIQSWNYMYIDDAVRATAEVCLRCGSGIYNIASKESRPLREYLEEARRVCGSTSELRFGVRGDNAEGGAGLRPCTQRLTRTGFQEEVSFAEGIRRTLAQR